MRHWFPLFSCCISGHEDREKSAMHDDVLMKSPTGHQRKSAKREFSGFFIVLTADVWQGVL